LLEDEAEGLAPDVGQEALGKSRDVAFAEADAAAGRP
jgi:hypothetical protein